MYLPIHAVIDQYMVSIYGTYALADTNIKLFVFRASLFGLGYYLIVTNLGMINIEMSFRFRLVKKME